MLPEESESRGPAEEPTDGRADPAEGEVAAWEEVSSGRYMPRRIKGSCVGRALG